MSYQNQNSSPLTENEIDLREEILKYLRHWPWFIFSTILAIFIAFIALKVMSPEYSTSATIMIKESKNSPSSELAAFTDLGLMGGMNTNSVENEIGILKSYRLMENVVKELNLNIRYFEDSMFRDRELYLGSPVIANILSIDKTKVKTLKEASERTFRVNLNGSDKLEIIRISDGDSFLTDYMEPVNLGFAQITFHKNENPSDEYNPDGPILIQFNLTEKVASAYEKELNIQLKEKNSSLIELSIQNEVPKKSEDILDQLVREYNREAVDDKNQLAMNTAEFINERLTIINKELETVETGKVQFKEHNQLTDIQTESHLFMNSATEYKKKQQELETQIELATAMLQYMETGSASSLLPSNLGIQENMVNEEINRYNELVLEHNRILSASTEKNPVVMSISQQLEEIKGNIYHSLNRMLSNLEITRKSLERERAAIGSKIAAVPSKERQYRDIERQQQIKEALYLFLLQKREENSLSLAATTPKAKIVDHARSSDVPITPKPRIMYMAALILGLLIPFMIIYLNNIFNNKVRTRIDLEADLKTIPVIGEAPRIYKGTADLIEKNDRSMLAESFRILQHNLQYLLLRSKDKVTGLSIIVTSSIKGEGKTFTAFNLAMTLANSGKKVVIVGADLRNPQMQRYEPDSKNFLGVSDYLVSNDLQLKKLLRNSAFHSDLDLLASGSIPPNPSELLGQEKMKQLITELESMYDYVIIDTAPTMPVVDTFLINKHVDLTIYVVRAGYSDKKLLDFMITNKNAGKLGDLGVILNNVDPANFGYGNKYGYTYGEEKQSFWKQMSKRAAFWSL